MATLKSYSIQNDFSSGYNLSKLSKEILNSGFVSSFDGIVSNEDEINILGESLSNESGLNSLIAAHTQSISQKELDTIRFQKRAISKDQIIAELAADNMERVRNGVWTVSQLISLTVDQGLKDLLDDINTLSFEIAYSRVDGLTNSLLTNDIKAQWKSKLYSHFYLG